MSIKVSAETKQRAQEVAQQFGIPLSTLVNAYLIELGLTGQIHFGVAEMMTRKTEQIVEEAHRQIQNNELSPAFGSAEEAIEYLEAL